MTKTRGAAYMRARFYKGMAFFSQNLTKTKGCGLYAGVAYMRAFTVYIDARKNDIIHYTKIRQILSPPIPFIVRILLRLNTLAFVKY